MSRGTPFTVEASEYVLAAGGIENPRLLMISGLGGPAVGRYFMEHPRLLERYAVQPGDTALGRLVGRPGHRHPLRLALSDEAQRQDRLLNWHTDLQFRLAGQDGETWDATRRLLIAARRPWKESPFYQDAGGGRLRMRSRDVLSTLRRPDRAVIGVTSAVTGHPSLRRSIELWSSLEQAPDPENRVTLTDQLDALGMPDGDAPLDARRSRDPHASPRPGHPALGARASRAGHHRGIPGRGGPVAGRDPEHVASPGDDPHARRSPSRRGATVMPASTGSGTCPWPGHPSSRSARPPHRR